MKMTLHVKGFKIDRRKVANLVGATNTTDPLIDIGIRVIVGQLDCSAYLKIVAPPSLDGVGYLALIVALEIGDGSRRD